ncbi:MAG: hypothetical protein QXQ40_01115 [Candidatus Aenigmatarchaeota archaeon]
MRKVIIGLLILLIIAAMVGIVILVARAYICGGCMKWVNIPEIIIKEKRVSCEGRCREYFATGNVGLAVLFCSNRVLPPKTSNLLNPGKVDMIKSLEGLAFIEPWPVCEDAIFCPHFYVCSENNETITWSKCREYLCQYYAERHNGFDLNQKVVEIMQKEAKYPWGSCELPLNENWWYKYFGDEPCTNPP